MGDPGGTAVIPAGGRLLYEESVIGGGRPWRWLPVIIVVTFFAIAPLVVPFAVLAWLINYFRYRGAWVRIDTEYITVGTRRVRLAALDLSTLGQASNTWPWRALNSRYLGANAFWMRDSVGIRGVDRGKKYWVSVGTSRRDELVAVLQDAVPSAVARAETAGTSPSDPTPLPNAAWHADPWDPEGHLRWWDGYQWTGWTWPPADGAAPTPAPAPPSGAPTPSDDDS